MAASDQGEELAHDGIGGGRPGQAALKMAQSAWPVLPLDGDRAQVEEAERIIGPLGQLGIEDLAITLELALPQRRVGVAGVLVCDLGPTDRDITRRKAGKIRSCTICLQRTSSHTDYPIAFRLPSMTKDHRR